MTRLNMNILTEPLVSLDNICSDYEYVTEEEMIDVKAYVNDHTASVGNRPNQEQWTASWAELLSTDTPTYLTKPRLMLDGKGIFRFNQSFIKSSNLQLEQKYHRAMINAVQDRFLGDVSAVVEFGCGSGHNLVQITNNNSELDVFGSDWATSSQQILASKGIRGFYFDMKSDAPNYPPELKQIKDVAFLTVGSLEQLGKDWKNFLSFMIKMKPKKSIHIEPILEFYDPSCETDNLAIEYHQKRGYLDGFYLAAKRMGLLRYCNRPTFGNTFNEGFNILELKYE